MIQFIVSQIKDFWNNFVSENVNETRSVWWWRIVLPLIALAILGKGCPLWLSLTYAASVAMLVCLLEDLKVGDGSLLSRFFTVSRTQSVVGIWNRQNSIVLLLIPLVAYVVIAIALLGLVAAFVAFAFHPLWKDQFGGGPAYK